MYYTYLWTREDGTPYYVGKGTGRRAFQFHRRQHGMKAPSKERIVIYPAASEYDALETEIALIWYYGRKDLGLGCLINLTDGGENSNFWKGKHRDDRTKKLLSTKQAELWKNPEYRARAAKVNLGRRYKHKNQKTHCVVGHVLSLENLYVYPSGKRSCRACRERRSKEWNMALGLGAPKKKQAVPAETPSLNSTPMPSWMTGEAPTPAPRRKNPRIDSGGQLARGSMRAA